jgi:hypothetical protein
VTRKPPEPWERQKGETPAAFEAFTAYLEMRGRRSLRRLADRGRSGSEKGYRLSSLMEWSAKNNWQARTQAFDDRQAQAKIDGLLAGNRRAAVRMAEIAERKGEALTAATDELLRRIESNPEVLRELTLSELLDVQSRAARAYPRILQAERLSRGMSTDARDPDPVDPFEGMDRGQLDAYLTGVDDERTRREREAAREEA